MQVLDEDEPETKRRKPNSAGQAQTEKLESRLNGILCCAVCLDLPKMAIYQVGKKARTQKPLPRFLLVWFNYLLLNYTRESTSIA